MRRALLIGSSFAGAIALFVLAVVHIAHAQTRPGRNVPSVVLLQPTTPGTTQSGNIHIGGTASVGTLVTATTIPGTFYVSATVSNAGAIIQQTPSTPTLSITKGATGHYTVTGLTGMTVNSIVVGSPLEGAGTGMMFASTPGTDSFTVTITNGANAAVDNRFSFIVVKL